MGNCSFTNFSDLRQEGGLEMARAWGSEDPLIQNYKCFKLRIEKMFLNLSQKPLCNNLNADLLLYFRREGIRKGDLPKLKVKGGISEIEVKLTPYSYCHLVNISHLFSISANAQDKKPLESNPMSFASLQKKALLSGFV